MEITEFTVKCLLFGLPGIIAYTISDKLIIRKTQDISVIIITVFLYSCLSYLLVSGHYYIFWGLSYKYVFNMIINSKYSSSDITMLITGSIFGVVLAWIIGFFYRYNLINRIAHWCGATRRFGDVDVWHYFNNSNMDEKNDGYVYVRDCKVNLTYYGYIALYSDSGMERELLL